MPENSPRPPQFEQYDAVIVGGGFYGATLAIELASRFKRVLVLEREDKILRRASYVNQARVHNGYHYPRSVLTAYRSRINFPRFVAEYGDCIEKSFKMIYAIGKHYSNVSASQFYQFCKRIGAEITPATGDVKSIFNGDLIEEAFQVREYAFNADVLKDICMQKMRAAGVEISLKQEAVRASPAGSSGLTKIEFVNLTKNERSEILADHVFLCTYSKINQFLHTSGMPLIPFKHELTEISLIDVPDVLKKLGVTVMCGPFFSTMPFPARAAHSLYHVRYAPHFSWQDNPDGALDTARLKTLEDQVKHKSRRSNFEHMRHDAQRYLPALSDARFLDSLWEIRTVLPQSEGDDSRPILFSKHHGLKNFFCVTGGKIDNAFDLQAELRELDFMREEALR